MLFDRYKIHIQAFVNACYGTIIIDKSASPRTYVKIVYETLKKKRKQQTKKQNIVPRTYMFSKK